MSESKNKYILRIYTENEFLREKYQQRANFAEDAGVDLYCPEDLLFTNGTKSNKIDFQIRCQMVDTNNNEVSYMLVPRSSIVKTPLRLANSIGIIDSGYRSNIMAFVDNVNELIASEPLLYYNITQGNRLFQLIGPTLEPIRVELMDAPPSDSNGRKQGGFGSTGR